LPDFFFTNITILPDILCLAGSFIHEILFLFAGFTSQTPAPCRLSLAQITSLPASYPFLPAFFFVSTLILTLFNIAFS